ncbi:hypothetical protein ZTR_03150 [Talaromyces verruculosus]|nr:hypothetical protein ZTR_03150 [Talaromyces verruculosus]
MHDIRFRIPDCRTTQVKVVKKIYRSKDNIDELDVDMEYIWANGALNVGRFHWIPVRKELCETAEAPKIKALAIDIPGLLQSLHWTSQPLALGAEDVHIKMTAVGLNFKDVMIAMGVIPGDSVTDGSSPLGLEGAGYITKVGSNVKNVRVGDRVMTIGCETVGMATIIQRPAIICIKIPDQLTDEEAATMPVVYVTVLICVGICAMNVAKWTGAEIYATVGSEEKASFLMNEFGIPKNRIFNSRDSSFYEAIMEATNGVGVDLVLNSLSGELLSTSWKCVAPYGAMVEIGKRDMVGRGKLALAPFENNRTFLGGEAARFMVTQSNRWAIVGARHRGHPGEKDHPHRQKKKP